MAKYRITAPDGNTYEITGEGTEQEALAHFQSTWQVPQETQAPQAPQETQAPQTPQAQPKGNYGAALLEALKPDALRGVVKGVGGTAAYFGDLANLATNSLGITQTPKENLPSARYERLLGESNEPVSEAIGRGLGMVLDPAGRFLSQLRPGPSPKPAQLTLEQRTLNAGLDQGLKVPPRFAPNTPVGSALEPLASRSALQEDIQLANRPIYDNMARKANKLSQLDDLDVATLEGKVKDAVAFGYDPIRAIPKTQVDAKYHTDLKDIIEKWATNASFAGATKRDVVKLIKSYDSAAFTGKDAIDAIKTLRSDANDLINGAQPNHAAGFALRDVASTIEDLIERRMLGSYGKEMTQNFRDSRKAIAIANETMDAIIPGAGSVDPQVFTQKLLQRIPLTDELKTIGEFGGAFSPVAQFPRAGESMLYQRPSLGLGASPAGIAGQLAGGPARKLLMSDAYQASLRATPGEKRLPEWLFRMLAASPGQVNSIFGPTGASNEQ